MSDRLRETVFWVLPAVLVLTGCVRHHEKDVDVLARGPDVETVTVGSDYASRAVYATGGLDAWTRTKELQFNCVVTILFGPGLAI
jgi:hypothetical protein